MSDTTIYYKCGGAGGGDNIKYLAPEFDTGTNYMQGSKVLKDNLLYKCKFDNTIGAWNESRWTQIYFADDTAEPPQDAVNFLSPKFVKNTDYKEGDVVEYGGLTYTFTEDYNGEWDITKVERKYICELNSNLGSNKINFITMNDSTNTYDIPTTTKKIILVKNGAFYNITTYNKKIDTSSKEQATLQKVGDSITFDNGASTQSKVTWLSIGQIKIEKSSSDGTVMCIGLE